MSECVDQEARDRIAKIWTEIREHATDYWGPDKQNGRRSVIGELCERLDILESTVERRNQTRPQECLGLKAIQEYITAQKKEDSVLLVEKVKGKTLMRMQWVQSGILLLIAILTLIRK